MKEILKIFPTSIYIEDNFLSEKKLLEYENLILNNIYTNGGQNWVSKIKNSLGVYNLINDEKFSELTYKANDRANYFNEQFDFKVKNVKCEYAWFNIYEKGDFQEIHHHPNSIYSGVLFLKTTEKSSPLCVWSPAEHIDSFAFYNSVNDYNMLKYDINPIRNRFVLFKSYLKHMVPKQEDDNTRITIAFNFSI
jgi:uncharacterized protein (TIGR02466 family)